MIVHNALPVKMEEYDELPLSFENGFMFIEAISVVGEKEIPHRYLIHSGYSGAILYDDKFAEDTNITNHIEILKETRLSDSAGNVMIEKKGKLPRLILGNTSFDDMPVGFFQGAIGRQKMSILGGDLLKRFNVIIHADRDVIYLKANSLHSEPFRAS